MKAAGVTAIVLAVWGATAAHGDEPSQYLCIADHVVGVHYFIQTKSWGPQTFASGRKYLLRHLKGAEREGKYPSDTKSDPAHPIAPGWEGFTHLEGQTSDMSEWGFFQFGDKIPQATCSASFQCVPTMSIYLHFNPGSGRFESVSQSGYTYQAYAEKTWPGTPPDDGAISIGTCSAF